MVERIHMREPDEQMWASDIVDAFARAFPRTRLAAMSVLRHDELFRGLDRLRARLAAEQIARGWRSFVVARRRSSWSTGSTMGRESCSLRCAVAHRVASVTSRPFGRRLRWRATGCVAS